MRPPFLASFEVAAITVAATLGLGILSLPVALHATGLQPFLFTITVTLLAQICIVYFIVELFQHAVFYPIYAVPPAPKLSEHTRVNPAAPPSSPARGHPPPAHEDVISPSIFALADQFIPQRWLRNLFNIFVYFHFILLLVTYSLSAPQAFVALFPALSAIPFTLLCGGFFTACSILIYTTATRLLPVLSFATLFKAALLIVLVILTLLRALTIHRQPVNSWALPDLVDPFLVNTFAIGGTLHTMPVTFQLFLRSLAPSLGTPRARFDRAFFASYRLAVNVGVVVCYLLNVAWCVAVLFVVPQNAATEAGGPQASALPANVTLAHANEIGQISTVPLIGVLKATHDRSNHIVATIVNCFIAVSISISILIMLVATLNFLEGSVLSAYSPEPRAQLGRTDSDAAADDNDADDGECNVLHDAEDVEAPAWEAGGAEGGPARSRSFALLWRYCLSVGLILLIALLNPEALYRIMEGVLTVVNNLESAVLLIYMFVLTRRKDGSGRATASIPDKLGARTAVTFVAFTSVFYTLVVVVDVLFYLPSHMF